MAMLFDLCGVHPSLWCPGQYESRVDRTSDGTKSAGRKLALRGLHPKECTYRGAQWQRTLSAVYTTEFHNSWNLYKTGFFTIHDQVRDSPPEWGDGFEGFAKRAGTRQTQFLLQNSFTSLGNAMVGWERRYDRCKCDGFWPRARHAIVRNFVTYDRSEKHLRPQLMPYVGSFGAGVITATWQPGNPDYLVKGYQSAVTQAWVGSLINVLGEFAPEITRKLKKHKK